MVRQDFNGEFLPDERLVGCVHTCRPDDQLCVDCPRLERCPGCGTELSPTSGGKKQCRGCGFLLTCCDTV